MTTADTTTTTRKGVASMMPTDMAAPPRKLESLTDAELCDLYDRMQEALAQRERLRAEEARLREQELQRAAAADEVDRLEAQLAPLRKRHDVLSAALVALDGQIEDAEKSGPPWQAEDLRRARGQLENGLGVTRGGVMDERSGTVMERTFRVEPPEVLQELLPNQDWGDFVPVAVVEDRIADLEAKLASAERRAAA